MPIPSLVELGVVFFCKIVVNMFVLASDNEQSCMVQLCCEML